MAKTITLRLSDESYVMFVEWAKAENRSIANLIETIAPRRLTEEMFVSPEENTDILADEALLNRLRKGSEQALCVSVCSSERNERA